MGKKIPCVYIGSVPLRLSAHHGEILDGDGKPLASRDISTGQVIMMSEEEAIGMTIWIDPRGVLDPEKIGVGRCVKEEHAGLSPDELEAIGYQFHAGRSDFVTQAEAEAAALDAAKKAAARGASVNGKKENGNGSNSDQK